MRSNASLKFAEKNAHPCQNLQRWRPARCLRGVKTKAFVLLLLAVAISDRVRADETVTTTQTKFNFDCARGSVWEGDVGDGFQKHATEAGFNVGAGLGVRAFHSEQDHDLVLGDLHVGTMLTGIVAKDHFWRGNFELLGQLFGGEQIKPRNAYVVGVAPLLRYNFATGTRFVPFFDGGAGLTLTDIRKPDLSTDFEFNVQVGCGFHWFFTPKVSATLEGRWLHLSNAGIDDPNNGVNTMMVYLGANWFF